MKWLTLLSSAALATASSCASYPTTTVAGVEVIDTQIVRDARALVKTFDPFLYKHVMRCFLFGSAYLNLNETYKATVDVEVHALATLLHDLGWIMPPKSQWWTYTNRFEVDGALGALKFVADHADAKQFSLERTNNLQYGIRLHGNFGLEVGTTPTVAQIVTSIHLDNPDTPLPLPNATANAIIEAFPNFDIAAGANYTFTEFCKLKPDVTYNTINENFGTAYVAGYNVTGKHPFDYITAAIESSTYHFTPSGP
ncbi:hypothetical protein F5Y16DRAFT_422271 [Xylariaceae sp. FL0255]|nr:hypothetical protein F5Y16DRAFT_422271 [Xylariaceae sp. FL0255]